MSMEPPGPPSDSPAQPPPAPPTSEPAHAPPAYTPPPAYAPPPTTAAPRRGRGGLLAIALIVVVLLVGGGGYVVAGFVTANSKLNSSTDAYNKVTDHENKLTDLFNKLTAQFSKNDLTNATSDSIKQEKTLFQQLVTQSQSSQPTIAADDQTLANADASLSQNSWLTALSKSSLDRQSTKIEDFRAALKIANTILADYIKYGTFYETAFDAIIDIDTLSAALSAQDLNAAGTAVQTLKSDLTKAVSEDQSGAGITSQMPSFLTTLQKFATDFGTFVSAAKAGDSAAANAALSALDADNTKLNAFDSAAMAQEEENFYKQLIDSYNAAIDKANKA